MTRRRFVEPSRLTGNDRRTTRRYFLFTPDVAGVMAQIFWYCLGVAAKELNVTVHAAVLLATHPHYSVTDNDGNLPAFKKRFHRILAMCTKRFRNWDEEVFNKAPPGEHELLTVEATVRNLAYLIVNPVAAGAVRYAKDWPGAKTLVRDIGRRVIRVQRPKFWFVPKNWPEWIELRLEMPKILLEHFGSLEKAQEAIAREVAKLEREARQELEKEGRSFTGAHRVVRTPHTRQATKPSKPGARNPRFAAGGDVEAAKKAIERLRHFDATYEDALDKWKAGDRDVVFPHGTWWMRVHHGVRCAPPP